jgi:hypothetical protein
MPKILRYVDASLEELRDWQENGDDTDVLQFDSTEQMMEHLWDDYRVLKRKKKERERAKVQISKNVDNGSYKLVGITAKFKRKSLMIEIGLR